MFLSEHMLSTRPRSKGIVEVTDGEIPNLQRSTLAAPELRGLDILSPQHLSADAATSTLAFIGLLRDAMSEGVTVGWNGTVDPRNRRVAALPSGPAG